VCRGGVRPFWGFEIHDLGPYFGYKFSGGPIVVERFSQDCFKERAFLRVTDVR